MTLGLTRDKELFSSNYVQLSDNTSVVKFLLLCQSSSK